MELPCGCRYHPRARLDHTPLYPAPADSKAGAEAREAPSRFQGSADTDVLTITGITEGDDKVTKGSSIDSGSP